MKPFRRILHPTDFSKASGPAFARALELASQNRAELLLVHVLPPPVLLLEDGYVSPKTYADLDSSARRKAQVRLAALGAKARKAGVRVKAILLRGVPYDQIARTARAKSADLIVMGTHGRTGLSRFFMGSVAERVVRLGPCAVLTIRGR